jgi:kynureninase
VSRITRADCARLDAADPLREPRARFRLPDGVNYLDGNSLGALPHGVAEAVAGAVTEEWGNGLIRSWNAAGWYAAPGRLGARMARLLGAAPHQVTVADTLSVNIFKCVVAAARLRPGRGTILVEAGNFPSDNHMVESAARLLGLRVVAVPASEIAAALSPDVAVVELSHVNYKTAEVQDMAAVTAAIHAAGAVVVWDLAHSTGAVKLALDADGADFAVGCGYKFLNGGPGAPSHLYVAERHHAALDQPLTGWFAHAAPFAFEPGFRRADGIRAMLCSTPAVLSNTAFEAALAVFDGLDMGLVEGKGRALGDVMIALFDQRLAPLGCGLAVPRESARRGLHVSITHEHGYRVMQALIGRGVIGDFRAPDIMRFGFGPLYVRFVDVFDAVAAVEEILSTGAWRAEAGPDATRVT